MNELSIFTWGFFLGFILGFIFGSVVSDIDRGIWFNQAIYDKSIYQDINKTIESKDYKLWKAYKLWAYEKDLTDGTK